MAGNFKIMVVALPVMGLSFYGTLIAMQELSQVSASQSEVARVTAPVVTTNALLTGESIIAKTKSYKTNGGIAAPIKLTMASFKSGQGFENNNFAKPIIVAQAKPAPFALNTAPSIKAVKAEPVITATAEEQVIKSEDMQKVAEIKRTDGLMDVQNVSEVAKTAKPVRAATITSSDPYIDDVAPQDVNNSILYQASIQKSWADALVTSAFKAYGPKGGVVAKDEKKVASVQRAIAITPRILPSGRAFGGFTEGEFQKRELRCMATGLYFEARSEPVRGQLAVGQVIMNRVRSPDYPDTICGVIFQGDHRNTGCQFSFACDGKTDRPSNARLWQRSQKLAKDLTKGKVWLKDIANSTHYHADYVHPKWRRSMRRLKKIGRHIFYKSPNVSTTDTFQSVRS